MRADPVARVALVVEDEWLVRNHIVSELKAQGWVVVETDSGEDAVALLANSKVDLLLTDIQLAGTMTGWDVARAVRVASPAFPVIYASGNRSDMSQQVEGSLFFNKPYDPANIATACGLLITSRGR